MASRLSIIVAFVALLAVVAAANTRDSGPGNHYGGAKPGIDRGDFFKGTKPMERKKAIILKALRNTCGEESCPLQLNCTECLRQCNWNRVPEKIDAVRDCIFKPPYRACGKTRRCAMKCGPKSDCLKKCCALMKQCRAYRCKNAADCIEASAMEHFVVKCLNEDCAGKFGCPPNGTYSNWAAFRPLYAKGGK